MTNSVFQAFYDFILSRNIPGVRSNTLTTSYQKIAYEQTKQASKNPDGRLKEFYTFFSVPEDYNFPCSTGLTNMFRAVLIVDVFSSQTSSLATINDPMNAIIAAMLVDPKFVGLHSSSGIYINSCIQTPPGKAHVDEALESITVYGSNEGARHFMSKFDLFYEKVTS